MTIGLMSARAFDNFDYPRNAWQASGATVEGYRNTFTYDANGNRLTQERYDEAGQQFEKLRYNYAINNDNRRVKNCLYHVNDPMAAGLMPDDQGLFTGVLAVINTDNNYGNNQLGQLQRDKPEYIEEIHWRIDGKIGRIDRVNGSGLKELEFVHDAMGHRIAKKEFTDTHQWKKYYVLHSWRTRQCNEHL